MTDQRNLLLAVVLSMAILFGWDYFFVPNQAPVETPAETATQTENLPQAGPVTTPAMPGSTITAVTTRDAALAANERITIETAALTGSISVKGARLDDLTLMRYTETPDPTSDKITLFSPQNTANPYFAEFGWITSDPSLAVPDAETVWSVTSQGDITASNPLTLQWDNGAGLLFQRTVRLDENYMFTVEQTVQNTTDTAVTLFPYGLVARVNTPDTLGFFILHEGPYGVFNDTLKELSYDDLQDDGTVEETTTGGWIGLTDKYWLAALVFNQEEETAARFVHSTPGGRDRYQIDYRGEAQVIGAGQSVSVTNNLFAGAKVVQLLDEYAAELGVKRFDLAIDFGWFYFLTKPFFYSLTWLYGILGNFGLAIIAFTIGIKLVLFPLANKQYHAMSKMKALQPEVKKLQERFKDDKMKLNQEMMELYKREKANPLSGCLPIFVQIPIFFALYKVLFVTIEMRHAPFYGWIKDLSAPDPTSIFNLFGLLPYDVPSFLLIGAWPLIMGASMWLQQKMNPQPTDPIQAQIMMFLPIMFTALLAVLPDSPTLYSALIDTLSRAHPSSLTPQYA